MEADDLLSCVTCSTPFRDSGFHFVGSTGMYQQVARQVGNQPTLILAVGHGACRQQLQGFRLHTYTSYPFNFANAVAVVPVPGCPLSLLPQSDEALNNAYAACQLALDTRLAQGN